MANNIHILLSSELNDFFENQNSSTKIISWLDDFSQGPILAEFGSDSFWIKRYAFVEEKFNINHLQYFDSTIKPIVFLQDLSGIQEVILWSSNTIASQVNLLAVGSYLMASFRKDVRFTLVNLNKEKLNNTNKINFNTEKENKGIKITRNNILFLHNCWLTLVKNSAKDIQVNSFEHGKFPFLKKQISKYIKNQ